MSKSNWKEFIKSIYCIENKHNAEIVLKVKPEALKNYLCYIDENMSDDEDDFDEVSYFIDWLDEEYKGENEEKTIKKDDGYYKYGSISGSDWKYLEDLLKPYISSSHDNKHDNKKLYCLKSEDKRLNITFADGDNNGGIYNNIYNVELPIRENGLFYFNDLENNVLYEINGLFNKDNVIGSIRSVAKYYD